MGLSLTCMILFSACFLAAQVTTSLQFSTPIKTVNDLIHGVCVKTTNPSFCGVLLKTDQRSRDPNASLTTLGFVAVDAALSNLRGTSNLVGFFTRQAGGSLREKYQNCLSEYGFSTNNLNKAEKLLQFGDVRSFKTAVTMAEGFIHNCRSQFGSPPIEDPQVKTANQKLEDIFSVILVISGDLSPNLIS